MMTEETAVGMESETVRMESQTETAETQKAMMCDAEETMSRPPGKTDSPSKRKGNISPNSAIFFLWESCLCSQPSPNWLRF